MTGGRQKDAGGDSMLAVMRARLVTPWPSGDRRGLDPVRRVHKRGVTNEQFIFWDAARLNPCWKGHDNRSSGRAPGG